MVSPIYVLLASGLVITSAFATACPKLHAAPPVPRKTEPAAKAADRPSPSTLLKPLTKGQQDKLLKERLDGGMGYSFRSFSNMFLVTSRIKLSFGVGLMTSSRKSRKPNCNKCFRSSTSRLFVSFWMQSPGRHRPSGGMTRPASTFAARQKADLWKTSPFLKFTKSNGRSLFRSL